MTDPLASRLKQRIKALNNTSPTPPKDSDAAPDPDQEPLPPDTPLHDPDDPTDWLLPDPDFADPDDLPTPIPKARTRIKVKKDHKNNTTDQELHSPMGSVDGGRLPEHEAPASDPTVAAPTPPTAEPIIDYTIPPPYDPTSSAPYWTTPGVTSENFNLDLYLSTIPNLSTLLKHQEGRQALTRLDPFLFALVYLPQHLKQEHESTPTFADAHFEWARYALSWATPPPIAPSAKYKENVLLNPDHHAFIAPRNTGKTTWWFLILPMWAAAHGHKKFLAAFSDTATQAQTHLASFKSELNNNELLRRDYPNLCQPLRRVNQRAAVADRADQYTAANSFTFAARGIDSSTLGLKVDRVRPDVILLDDVEPDEQHYSADQAKKRLATIEDAIMPLNIFASVIMVGTVTMPNSIMHQLVKSTKDTTPNKSDTEAWIKKNKITAHHYDAIQTRPDGTQRSLWPNKWPMAYLSSIHGTRTYLKNYANDPRGRDGDYWNDGDFTRVKLPYTTRRSLHIDPPVSVSKTSDPAGLAVVSWMPPREPTSADIHTTYQNALAHAQETGNTAPAIGIIAGILSGNGVQQMSIPQPKFSRKERREQRDLSTLISKNPGTVMVEYAAEVKLTGNALFKQALKIIAEYGVQRVVIETTQGGDLWLEIFAGCPVPVYTIAPRESKDVRAARALKYYQSSPPMVVHDPEAALSQAEEQMLAFPKAAHDDIVDAVVAGTLYHLEPRPKKQRTGVKKRTYGW